MVSSWYPIRIISIYKIRLNWFSIQYWILRLFPVSIDIDDCQKDVKSSYQHKNCFPGVECKDRKAPRRGFDCAPCPKGFVGNGKICQKESELTKNLLPMILLKCLM